MRNPWTWFIVAMLGLGMTVVGAALQGDSLPKMPVTVYHPYKCRLVEPKPRTQDGMEFSQTFAEFGETDFIFLCDGRHFFKVTKRVSRKNATLTIDPYREGIYLEKYQPASTD
ncbi:MAG: hypothetical protein IH945_00355 [Armatimonadetes bacterium]|nr:hypothetical protein [Armatimonadota bacterium]